MAEESKEQQAVGGKQIVLVTGSNGMVGHCIREMVNSLQGEETNGSKSAMIDDAWDVLHEHQDRESLIAVLKQIVPTVSFYFSTRENDGSLSDQTKVEILFQRIKPTFVIHLAAKVGGLFANLNDKVGFFEENLAMNSNMIKASHAHGVKKLVCVLSTCIYPDDTTYPIAASSLH